jgi:hypothetical protein
MSDQDLEDQRYGSVAGPWFVLREPQDARAYARALHHEVERVTISVKSYQTKREHLVATHAENYE